MVPNPAKCKPYCRVQSISCYQTRSEFLSDCCHYYSSQFTHVSSITIPSTISPSGHLPYPPPPHSRVFTEFWCNLFSHSIISMAAAVNLPSGMSTFKSPADCLSSTKKISELFFQCELRRARQRVCLYRSTKITNGRSYENRDSNAIATTFSPNGSAVSVSILFVCVCLFVSII